MADEEKKSLHEKLHEQGIAHVHSHPQKKIVTHRLSSIIGHLNGIRQMVNDEEDCSEILLQLSAVQSALLAVGKIVLNDHLEHCIVDAIETHDDEALKKFGKALDSFIR